MPVLTFGLALLPGLTAFLLWRGPRVEPEPTAEPPDASLPEIAVLRDGAVGHTRWAFAAMIVGLARDGHCTLVRTRKRRWLRTGPVLTADRHADPTALSALEQTVLRQIDRHDTLGGFGFAGSTFRRRTLRDVRADLVERGWLADRSRASTVLIGLAFVLAGAGLAVALTSDGLLAPALLFGPAAGSAIGAFPRYPVTETGARHRAAHRAYAERQRDRVHNHLTARPDRAARLLHEALPHLVLERIATPRWLATVADRLDAAAPWLAPPDWLRDETDELDALADTYRALSAVLEALDARTPLYDRCGIP